jgi:hypothetical protein
VFGWRLGVRLGKIWMGIVIDSNWIFCLSKRDAYLEQALKVVFYSLLVLWRLLIRIYRLNIHSDLKATIDTDRILTLINSSANKPGIITSTRCPCRAHLPWYTVKPHFTESLFSRVCHPTPASQAYKAEIPSKPSHPYPPSHLP